MNWDCTDAGPSEGYGQTPRPSPITTEGGGRWTASIAQRPRGFKLQVAQ